MRMKLYGAIISLISAIFFGYVFCRIFYPSVKSAANLLKGYGGVVPALFLLVLLWGLDRIVIRRMKTGACAVSVVVLTLLNTVLQVICILFLRVNPSWDFGAVMAGASDVAAGRPIGNMSYFSEYPFNLTPAVLIGTFGYIFGGSPWAPYLLNVLALTSSVAGACMAAWRVFSPAASVRTALFCLAATPLYLYAPIVYTDTLSMPFAIWSVYAWSFIRFPSLQPGKGRVLPACSALGLLAAAGYLVKPVAAVGLAAFALDYAMCFEDYGILRNKPVGRRQRVLEGIVPVLVSFLFFSLLIGAVDFYMDFKGYTVLLQKEKRFPAAHWLMMGVNKPYSDGGTSYFGYGGFSNEDLGFARSFITYEQRKAAEYERIVQRLGAFGTGGYASFLLKKMEWTWTDGTYFAPVKLERLPLNDTSLHKFILFGEDRTNSLYLVFTQLCQAVLLLLMLTGAVLSLEGTGHAANRYMLLMCLGLMLFLLVWETRPRYLVFMIPVFIVLASSDAGLFSTKIDKITAK